MCKYANVQICKLRQVTKIKIACIKDLQICTFSHLLILHYDLSHYNYCLSPHL